MSYSQQSRSLVEDGGDADEAHIDVDGEGVQVERLELKSGNNVMTLKNLSKDVLKAPFAEDSFHVSLQLVNRKVHAA